MDRSDATPRLAESDGRSARTRGGEAFDRARAETENEASPRQRPWGSRETKVVATSLPATPTLASLTSSTRDKAVWSMAFGQLQKGSAPLETGKRPRIALGRSPLSPPRKSHHRWAKAPDFIGATTLPPVRASVPGAVVPRTAARIPARRRLTAISAEASGNSLSRVGRRGLTRSVRATGRPQPPLPSCLLKHRQHRKRPPGRNSGGALLICAAPSVYDPMVRVLAGTRSPDRCR